MEDFHKPFRLEEDKAVGFIGFLNSLSHIKQIASSPA